MCVHVRGSPDRDIDITVLLDRYPITSILCVISHGVYSLIGSFLHFLENWASHMLMCLSIKKQKTKKKNNWHVEAAAVCLGLLVHLSDAAPPLDEKCTLPPLPNQPPPTSPLRGNRSQMNMWESRGNGLVSCSSLRIPLLARLPL